MTKWAASLIRISNHEVETLQKRLADIVERRQTAEVRVAMLDAEAEAEARQAEGSIEAGWYMIGFRQGAKIRRQEALLAIDEALLEERGARDELTSREVVWSRKTEDVDVKPQRVLHPLPRGEVVSAHRGADEIAKVHRATPKYARNCDALGAFAPGAPLRRRAPEGWCPAA